MAQPLSRHGSLGKIWKAQTMNPKIDLPIYLAKFILSSAGAVWAVRKAPLSSRQIMLVSTGTLLFYAGTHGFDLEEQVYNSSGCVTEPVLATLLVSGAYGLYRAGGVLLPSCFRSFKWTTLLDILYHGGVGICSLMLGAIVGAYSLPVEASKGNGVWL